MRTAMLLKICAIALFAYDAVKALKIHRRGETIDAIYYLAWAAIMYMAANF